MIQWSQKQAKRMVGEQKRIARYASWARFSNPTTVEGFLTNQIGTTFFMRLTVGANYPVEMPRLYIATPLLLPMKQFGKYINDLGCNHAFHVYGVRGPIGEIEICHTFNWTTDMTLLSVLYKAILWCQGYGYHMQTGKSIDDFLKMIDKKLSKKQTSKSSFLNHDSDCQINLREEKPHGIFKLFTTFGR